MFFFFIFANIFKKNYYYIMVTLGKQKKLLEIADKIDRKTPYHYYTLSGKKAFYGKFQTIIYSPTNNPAFIYSLINKNAKKGNYYITYSKFDEHGNILPKKQYRNILMFHKKYSRRDIEIKNVDFKVVGLKRKTTHRPAGLLIEDIIFY